MPLLTNDATDVATLLHAASITRKPIAPVRHMLAPGDIDSAYAVQDQLARLRGRTGSKIVGHKIEYMSTTEASAVGPQPICGLLFDGTGYLGGDEINLNGLISPMVTATIALVLGSDIRDEKATRGQVRHAVKYAVAALDIADSRITGWDVAALDSIADNASSGLHVLGPRRLSADEIDRKIGLTSLAFDGAAVSNRQGSTDVVDPFEALAWLTRHVSERGRSLRAGQLVLTGALCPMRPVKSGHRIRADFAQFGAVSACVG